MTGLADLPTVPVEELRSLGVISEVNRRLLHPIGLALGVNAFGEIMVLDGRDDPEGFLFEPSADEEIAEKADRFRREEEARFPARAAALGYIVQPLARPHTDNPEGP